MKPTPKQKAQAAQEVLREVMKAIPMGTDRQKLGNVSHLLGDVILWLEEYEETECNF